MNKQLLSFNVMSAVQSSYAAEGMSDSKFAEKLTNILGVEVTTARVRQARNALGIANNVTTAEALELQKLREAAINLSAALENTKLPAPIRKLVQDLEGLLP